MNLGPLNEDELIYGIIQEGCLCQDMRLLSRLLLLTIFTCTLSRGHQGEHECYGSESGLIHRFPNLNPPPHNQTIYR